MSIFDDAVREGRPVAQKGNWRRQYERCFHKFEDGSRCTEPRSEKWYYPKEVTEWPRRSSYCETHLQEYKWWKQFNAGEVKWRKYQTDSWYRATYWRWFIRKCQMKRK